MQKMSECPSFTFLVNILLLAKKQDAAEKKTSIAASISSRFTRADGWL